MKNALHGFAFLCATAFLCMAQARADGPVPPPSFSNDDLTATPSMKRAAATRLRLGAFDVVLEETPLSRVRDAMSSGVIAEQGDTSEHIYWLCYTIARETDKQRVWLISDAEFGGPEHDVTSITAENTDAGRPISARCPLLPSRYLPMSLDHNVWLDMSRNDLIHRLGKPSEEKGERLKFYYAGKAKVETRGLDGSEGPREFDVTSELEVELYRGRVTRLWASKVTSD